MEFINVANCLFNYCDLQNVRKENENKKSVEAKCVEVELIRKIVLISVEKTTLDTFFLFATAGTMALSLWYSLFLICFR